MSGWQTALDNKLDALDWLRSKDGRNFIEVTSESQKERDETEGRIWESLLLGAESAVARATPLYVHPDILDIAEVAAENFLPEALAETDLITPWCFMSLPRRIMIPDINGKMTAISRFSWSPLTTVDDEGTLHQGIAVLMWSTLEDWENDDSADQTMLMDAEGRKAARLTITHATPWWFGKEFPDAEGSSLGVDWWRRLQVLLRLAMQQISLISHADAPRPSRRRAKRIDLDEPTILVVTLRRLAAHKQQADGAKQIEWKHQWIVHGFWRAQWYPSIGVHRQIYIHDYVKGDPSLPLKVHAGRVFQLIR